MSLTLEFNYFLQILNASKKNTSIREKSVFDIIRIVKLNQRPNLIVSSLLAKIFIFCTTYLCTIIIVTLYSV